MTRKQSHFPTNGDAEKMRHKAAWFGMRGMEKTATDFYAAADALDAMARRIADLEAELKTVQRTA